MSSTLDNQDTVARWATYPQVQPAFGIHPWFVHLISMVPTTKDSHYKNIGIVPESVDSSDYCAMWPDPTPLDVFISSLERHLAAHPNALVGEIGIDGSFRVKPHLSHQTSMAHQKAIALAQLHIALKFRRPVSMHSVRAPAHTVDLLDAVGADARAAGVNICLHSLAASAETVKLIVKRHPNVYFSFSSVISMRSPKKFAAVVQSVPLDRILVESDLHDLAQQDAFLLDIIARLSLLLKMVPESLVLQFQRNWDAFSDVQTTRLHCT